MRNEWDDCLTLFFSLFLSKVFLSKRRRRRRLRRYNFVSQVAWKWCSQEYFCTLLVSAGRAWRYSHALLNNFKLKIESFDRQEGMKGKTTRKERRRKEEESNVRRMKFDRKAWKYNHHPLNILHSFRVRRQKRSTEKKREVFCFPVHVMSHRVSSLVSRV